MDKIPPLVFHADWFEIIEDLPQEQQLEVYRAIMLYAFRGKKSTNPLAQATTALMRKFIDQDRVKYDEICKKRKEAVKRRWDKLKNTSDTNVYNCIQENTSDTNTNTNTSTNTSTNTREEIDKSIPSAAIYKTRTGAEAAAAPELQAQIAELKGREIWLEQVAMKFRMSKERVCRRLDDFREDMELRGRRVSNPQSLFVTWLTERERQTNPDSAAEPGLGVGEYRNGKGERTYAHSGITVPENAPPRPSSAHWWSEASGQWENAI